MCVRCVGCLKKCAAGVEPADLVVQGVVEHLSELRLGQEGVGVQEGVPTGLRRRGHGRVMALQLHSRLIVPTAAVSLVVAARTPGC